jgi:hypothetical protein
VPFTATHLKSRGVHHLFYGLKRLEPHSVIDETLLGQSLQEQKRNLNPNIIIELPKPSAQLGNILLFAQIRDALGNREQVILGDRKMQCQGRGN